MWLQGRWRACCRGAPAVRPSTPAPRPPACPAQQLTGRRECGLRGKAGRQTHWPKMHARLGISRQNTAAQPSLAQLRTCFIPAVRLAAAAAPVACLASQLPAGTCTAPTHTSSRLACTDRHRHGACNILICAHDHDSTQGVQRRKPRHNAVLSVNPQACSRSLHNRACPAPAAHLARRIRRREDCQHTQPGHHERLLQAGVCNGVC